MRGIVALATGAMLFGLPAAAERYADYGKPEQCGAYPEARYDRSEYFPGGEGGLIALNDPQSVRGLNALLFDGTVTEEGMSDPVGRVLVARGPLREVTGEVAPEVVVVITESGIRLLEPCP